MNRNKMINIMNHALQLIPEENEVYDYLEDVINQLEEEWKDEFVNKEDYI